MKRPARRDPPGQDSLLRDLEQAGCPVCRDGRRSATALIERVLYESVNDRGLRARMRAAHGFCTDHALLTWQLAAASSDSHAIAVLYRDFLAHIRKEALREVSSRPRWRLSRGDVLAPTKSCLVCESVDERADMYLDLLAEAAPDSELGVAARRRDRGVCVPHLRRGLRSARSRAGAERLLDIYLRAEEQIRDDVGAYLDWLDAQDSEPGRERGAWVRALLWVTGLPAHTSRAERG